MPGWAMTLSLAARASIDWRSMAGVLVAAYSVVGLVYFVLLYAYDELDFHSYADFFGYTLVLIAIGFLSPVFTYALLRGGGYRFAFPPRAVS